MEQIITWKSPKILAVVGVSLLLLFGLLLLGNYVRSPVDFPDPNLEQVVREKIEKRSGTIYKADLMLVTELYASGREIQSLEGIEALTRLVSLNLADNQIENLTPLSDLKMLRVLDLSNNQITDLDGIHLNQIIHIPLRELHLGNEIIEPDRGIRDISLLSALTHLEILTLRNNLIMGLTPLRSLGKLKELDLRGNKVNDIEPLSKLVNLEKLNLRENAISDLEPLVGLVNLTYINIHSNPVENGLEVLANFGRLETLIMRNVRIGEDYAFLENLTNLKRLNIRNTQIADVSVIGQLMESGALQDSSETGVTATVDLLEIFPLGNGRDAYASLRRYWDNIHYRYPISLPYYPSSVRSPMFSHQSGFYENQFLLEISTEETGGIIFFTSDGSEPALTPELLPMGTTQEYVGLILIRDRSSDPNELAEIKTSVRWLHHTPPGEVFKGNVLRAIVIDEEGNRSDIVSQSFFIEENMSERYTFPIISLIGNPAYFFSDDIGIYVPGDLAEPIQPDQHWSEDRANFFERGLKWERPVTFQMFSPSGDMELEQEIGIRIHGNFTRLFTQKSLRMYAREEYDGIGLIQYDMFPELNDRMTEEYVNTYKSLILRNGGNAWLEAFFRDVLAQNLLKHVDLDIQGFKPAIVFLNGEYWGIYNVRTRYDEHYFSSYYGIEPDELTVLDGGGSQLYIGKPGDEERYLNLLTFIDEEFMENDYETIDSLSDPSLYEEFISKIDIDNFINYYISHIYFKNTDWPHNNVRFWKKNVTLAEMENDIKYGHDGRWRWMIMDIDHGFMNPSHNTLYYATLGNQYKISTFLIRSLLENEQFKGKFINTFADHLNTTFREEVVLKQIDIFEALYAPEIEEQIHRWGNLGGSYSAWEQNVEDVREFANLRPEYQREHISELFDLAGSAQLTIQTDPSKGYIRINTIDIIESTPGVEDPANWSGIYFQGIPIEINALPHEGYEFVRWEVNGPYNETDSSRLIVKLDTNLNLLAVFEPN